jgi:hypothetical protein
MGLRLGLFALPALLGTAAVALLVWSPWESESQSPSLTSQAAVKAAGSYMENRYGGATNCVSADYIDSDNVWLVSCTRCAQSEPPDEYTVMETCPGDSFSHVVLVDDSTSRAHEDR